jgi:hypothetical protein
VAGGGRSGFFAVLGGLMIVNMLSFLTVRGHIPAWRGAEPRI